MDNFWNNKKSHKVTCINHSLLLIRLLIDGDIKGNKWMRKTKFCYRKWLKNWNKNSIFRKKKESINVDCVSLKFNSKLRKPNKLLSSEPQQQDRFYLNPSTVLQPSKSDSPLCLVELYFNIDLKLEILIFRSLRHSLLTASEHKKSFVHTNQFHMRWFLQSSKFSTRAHEVPMLQQPNQSMYPPNLPNASIKTDK
jgi:hypothetical protein